MSSGPKMKCWAFLTDCWGVAGNQTGHGGRKSAQLHSDISDRFCADGPSRG